MGLPRRGCSVDSCASRGREPNGACFALDGGPGNHWPGMSSTFLPVASPTADSAGKLQPRSVNRVQRTIGGSLPRQRRRFTSGTRERGRTLRSTRGAGTGGPFYRTGPGSCAGVRNDRRQRGNLCNLGGGAGAPFGDGPVLCATPSCQSARPPGTVGWLARLHSNRRCLDQSISACNSSQSWSGCSSALSSGFTPSEPEKGPSAKARWWLPCLSRNG